MRGSRNVVTKAEKHREPWEEVAHDRIGCEMREGGWEENQRRGEGREKLPSHQGVRRGGRGQFGTH